jgi:4-amino-4-deoxy-L-arabinose transferase-like glycosyltransferase
VSTPTVHESPGPRQILVSAARVILAVGALLLVYFMVPLQASDNLPLGLLAAVLGVTVFAAIFVRQVRRIRNARYPMLRAIEAVALVATLFVVVLSGVHYGLAQSDPSAYSEPLSRLDAMYFVVTTLATVGFGDITPTSEVTRAVTTVQMVLGVALLGAGVKVLLGVANEVADQRKGAGASSR